MAGPTTAAPPRLSVRSDANRRRKLIIAKKIKQIAAAERTERAADLVARNCQALNHRLPVQPEHLDYRTGNQRRNTAPSDPAAETMPSVVLQS